MNRRLSIQMKDNVLYVKVILRIVNIVRKILLKLFVINVKKIIIYMIMVNFCDYFKMIFFSDRM